MRYLLTCSFFFGCQIHQALLPSPGSRFLFSAHPTDDTTVLLLSSDTNNTFPSSSFPNQLSMLSLQYNTHDIPSPIYKNLPAFLLHELCNFPLLPPVETTDKRIASHAETEHKLQHVIIITPALFSPSPFLVTRSNTVSLSLSLSTSFRKSKLSNLLGSRKRRFAARKNSGKIRASPEMSISPFLLLQNIRASSG
jgi:hypothetical protein